ncbi:MAG: hypothetical protein HY900_18785 [Deltaproteobacteria bacterium]|nr:hypothetical protein [Deltaproteobacteria bacterium]
MYRIKPFPVFALLIYGIFAVPSEARVDVDVHIGVPVPVVPVAPPPPPPPPPVYVIPEPVTLVLVPSAGVYFAPGLTVDLFFASGYWWWHDHGYWRCARHCDGPWAVVERRRVPRAVLTLPPSYRTVYAREKPIPYGQWKKRHYREVSHRRGERHWDEDHHRKGEGEKRHGKGKHGKERHDD